MLWKYKYTHWAAIGITMISAYAVHILLTSREVELRKLMSNNITSSTNGPNVAAIEGRKQAAQIAQLLEDLEKKSTREKIEDAYTAATHTHDIGFPSSISQKREDSQNKRC
jgi:hypothetical protein